MNWLIEPFPSPSMNRTAITWLAQLMPLTPTPWLPAAPVVLVGVAVVGEAVGPAPLREGLEDVAGVDAAVGVPVGDLARADVAAVVQVAEGDQPVAVGVDQLRADGGGDLPLVDPDVL